jgi:hypothetical protein
MNRTLIIRAVLVTILVFLVIYLYGGNTVPVGQQPLMRLDTSNIVSLRDTFNGSADSVRILVLLSPT